MTYTPPSNISKRDRSKKSVFIAGTIDMGKNIPDWQKEITSFFEQNSWDSFNPRRADWDASWLQEFENPQFSQQVRWELNALEVADIILMYFLPDSVSPISLLELGIHIRSKKLYVVCPHGFWRKGNVDITCDFYDVPLFDTLEEFKTFFKEYILK